MILESFVTDLGLVYISWLRNDGRNVFFPRILYPLNKDFILYDVMIKNMKF